MEVWEPFRDARKKLYKKNHGGKEPGLEILWFDKRGDPIYCPPGNTRLHAKPSRKLDSAFRHVSRKLRDKLGCKVTYYCWRATYATNFVIEIIRAHPERSDADLLNDLSARQDLANKMGHKDEKTTWRHYIVIARVRIADLKNKPSSQIVPGLLTLVSSALKRFKASMAPKQQSEVQDTE